MKYILCILFLACLTLAEIKAVQSIQKDIKDQQALRDIPRIAQERVGICFNPHYKNNCD